MSWKVTDLVNSYKELDELCTKIEAVSGYTVEQLLELFMAGYILQEPKYKSLRELGEGLESDE